MGLRAVPAALQLLGQSLLFRRVVGIDHALGEDAQFLRAQAAFECRDDFLPFGGR